MVVYELVCGHGHQFEGWFPAPEAFDAQKVRGLVTCQFCGDEHVSKVNAGGPAETPECLPRVIPAPEADGQALPTEILATGEIDGITVLKALRHYVKTHFENVGKDFASLARKMRDGEIPQKNIYGEATPEEIEELADEEIPHIVLRDLPPEFKN
ncbi:MAG TPA: DUF1178 family protein [bacterium]|nr:DUF1178 family protein [bacterium]